MKKRLIYYFSGLLLIIGIIIVVIMLVRKPREEVGPEETQTKEDLELEISNIEEELKKIEEVREEKAEKINELSKKRGDISIKNPTWGEVEIRSSQEYLDLTSQIEALQKEVEELDNKKLPYYDKEIEIQDKIRTLEE